MGLGRGLSGGAGGSTAFMRKPFTPSDLKMAFLKSFLWQRILGTCFFEEVPHKDRKIEFYLKTVKIF